VIRRGWSSAIALVCGICFGAGLLLSGMTRPEKVLGFLDVFGAWDPSLAFVMIGAIGVHAVASRWARTRPAPVLASKWSLPPVGRPDAKLIVGAAVFGVGWGLSGYCPGPAVVSLASGALPVVAFVGAMLAGTLIAAFIERLPPA
jgi:uncharacterized membrane protein YedE/YeeE